MMTTDEKYMCRCLQLAFLGGGAVAPNPMVGAVLVHNNKIIGEGYHKKYGAPHAEVNCINSVNEHDKNRIEQSTLYVNLEPCVHHGKTPPCADLIIKNKIPKVIVGCRDVFKEVNGRGIEKLRNAGVQVVTDVLEKECVQINKRFFTFHQKQRPYIILKWAQSIDGKISSVKENFSKERILISNQYSNRVVHKWRSEEAAIMIGTNTAFLDDPSLTTRLWKGQHPVRIVIDMNLRLPTSLKIFNKEVKTIIFNTKKHDEEGNLMYYKLEPGDSLREMVKVIYSLKIQSIIVEGGTVLLQSFIDLHLWDEARIICNEQLVISNGIKAPELTNQGLQKTQKYFGDVISYYLHHF